MPIDMNGALILLIIGVFVLVSRGLRESKTIDEVSKPTRPIAPLEGDEQC
jgi:hypothetical protein